MKIITYVGKDTEKVFVKTIENLARRIFRRSENTVPMVFYEEARKP